MAQTTTPTRGGSRWVRPVFGCILAFIPVLIRTDSGPGPARGEPPKATTGKASRRPNLLILVADDLRGGMLGVDGDPHRATPRLDALAGQGVRFDRAFCNSPVCTPSRQSFLTGRLPHATGVTLLKTPLPSDAVTLAHVLGRAGYVSAAIGKMHFNSNDRHGFDERIDTKDWETWLAANPPAGGDKRTPWRPFLDPASVWLNADCRPSGLPTASMESTYFADRAIQYVKDHRSGPFALVVGFYDPHSPFRFPDDQANRFRPESFDAPPMTPADARDRPLIFRDLTSRDARGIRAAYDSSLAYLDGQIGRVVGAVDALGLAEETVVVFLGDNGYMLGEHGRFEKHCFYEQAIRVPMLVRWPGRLPAGRSVGAMVELVDLLPTVLELVGVAAPKGIHGRSLVPLLKGEPNATGREVVFSEYLENEEAMVRSGRYKLVVGTGRRKRQDGYMTADPTPGPYERLYDLEADPGEDVDVSGRPGMAAVKSDLLARLHHRLVTTRDGVTPAIPPGLSTLEAIHFCLVPRDAEPKGAPR